MKRYTNELLASRHITRAAYAKYLKTKRWRRLRAHCKRRANDWCEYPGCENLGAEAHHTSYANRGGDFDKELADLQWLCRRHHRQVHGL